MAGRIALQQMTDILDQFPTTDTIIDPAELANPAVAEAVDRLVGAYLSLRTVGVSEAGVARMMLGAVESLYDAIDMLPALPGLLRRFADQIELLSLIDIVN